jgi:hypothetical protein
MRKLLPAFLIVTLAGGPAAAKPAKKRPPARTAPTTAAPSPAAAPAPAAPAAADAAAETKRDDDAKPGLVAASATAAEPARPAPPPPAAARAPAADAKEPAAPPPPAPSADLERLRAEYDRLRDDLFRARSRARIVEDGLYASKLSATFRWKGAPAAVIHHATLRLDGAEIWDSGDKVIADDLISVAERAVKPGPHALTLRLEIRPGKKSKDSDKLGYSSEHTFAVIVPDGLRTHVAITGDEDGDAPEYEPEIEVELESEK